MQAYSLVAPAAAPMAETVRAITTDHLAAPTPCREYDVRKLLNHLLYWGPSLVGAAKDAPVAPPAPSEQAADLVRGDWVEALSAQLDQIVTAWGEPQAWEGTTRMGGPEPVPAAMIGGMVIGELVLHGWDLARATGRPARWDDEVTEFVNQELVKTAEQGRELGVYGPAVAVPATAPTLDRALGRSGRDPGWRP